MQRAPFDLILAVQDKRPSFVSLADILAKTAHFGKLYLAKPRNERFLANCHVKWSTQKGIGEVSWGLCQTDGTPCCVFDWKRKVTFAATSKRQWSAKQIGLRSTPTLERTPLQGTSEAVFQNNAMFASFLREGICLPPFHAAKGRRGLCWKRLQHLSRVRPAPTTQATLPRGTPRWLRVILERPQQLPVSCSTSCEVSRLCREEIGERLFFSFWKTMETPPTYHWGITEGGRRAGQGNSSWPWIQFQNKISRNGQEHVSVRVRAYMREVWDFWWRGGRSSQLAAFIPLQ